MNSRARFWITLLGLGSMLTVALSLIAQQQNPSPPPVYSASALRPLGGRQSNVIGFARLISNHQAMVGSAETANLDPNYPNANGLIGANVFTQHAAVIQHAIRTDLGVLPGGNNSGALWVNGNGTAVGISENGVINPLIGSPEGRATMWKSGNIIDMGTLGGNESIAWAVNSAELSAGCAANDVPDDNSAFGWGTQTRAFLYQNGTMTDIGTLGGTDACATMLNDAGQVAGFSYTADGNFDTFFYNNGHMIDMGNLGGTFGYPNAINSSGQVTGLSNLTGDSIEHGYFWDGAAMHDIGSLSNRFGTDYSQGYALNDAGHVVGESRVPGVAIHAILWRDGVLTDLGTLPGDLCSIAWGINNHDQIVGASGQCDSPQHAVLWQNGQIYDLTHVLPLGAVMTAAFYIDDAGNIAAVGNVGFGGNGLQAYTTGQRAYILLPFGGGGSDHDAVQQVLHDPATKSGAQREFLNRAHAAGRFSPPSD